MDQGEDLFGVIRILMQLTKMNSKILSALPPSPEKDQAEKEFETLLTVMSEYLDKVIKS